MIIYLQMEKRQLERLILNMINLINFLQKLEYQPSQEAIERIDHLLLQGINNYLSKIKSCTTIPQANAYFDVLQKTQELLAILVFRENLTVSDKLWKFIGDCDRLDDPWLRNHLFNLIKTDKYSL